MQDTPDDAPPTDAPTKIRRWGFVPLTGKRWGYTPYWLKPIVEGHVSRDVLQTQVTRIEDVHQASKQRLELIVAVANGAALAACGSKVLDALTKAPTPETVALVKLLVPSLVCFVVGLTAVGMAAAVRIFLMETRLSQLNALLVSTPEGGAVPVTVRWANPSKFSTAWLPETIAGSAFFSGVLFPLIDVVQGVAGKGPWTW